MPPILTAKLGNNADLFPDVFVAEDLFVMVRSGPVFVGRCQERQVHARKNHSYFVVLRKVQ